MVVGTPGTTSQYAKDVVTFLSWAAEPEHDDRKKLGLQSLIVFSTLLGISLYVKRFKWTTLKSRKIGMYNQPLILLRHPMARLTPTLQSTTLLNNLSTRLGTLGAVVYHPCIQTYWSLYRWTLFLILTFCPSLATCCIACRNPMRQGGRKTNTQAIMTCLPSSAKHDLKARECPVPLTNPYRLRSHLLQLYPVPLPQIP